MPGQLLPNPPLQLHPRKTRKLLAIAFGLLIGTFVPFLVGLITALVEEKSLRAGEVVPYLLILLAGLVPGVLVLGHWRRLKALGRDFVEVHARITRRQEQLTSGIPNGQIKYGFRLVRGGGFPDLEGSLLVPIQDGGPLFADDRGEQLVVLASRKKKKLHVALHVDGYPFQLPADTARALKHRMVEQGVAISFGRGFRNLESVRRGLRVLLGAEAQGRLPHRPAGGRVELPSGDLKDPVVGIQKVARSIANAFGFNPGTVLVTLRDDLAPAGRVEYEPGQGFFVDLRRELIKDSLAVQVALSHEVAHILLAARGLVDSDRFEQEVQTDLAAALWGFGGSMIAYYKSELREINRTANSVTWERKVKSMGYITPEECAYAMAKQYNPKVFKQRVPRHARRAIRLGARRARREARLGILDSAPFLHRLFYRLRSLLKYSSRLIRFEPDKVSFACPHCTQQMRLPLGKSGTATCPNCRAELPFCS